MNSKKVASFSLLAHINDNNIGITSFNDIFIPIVKSSLCRLNNAGIKSGESILEIKEQIDKSFALDIPIPILKKLLFSISSAVEENPENQFILHKDGAFQMNNFLFANYEEELEEKESEVNEIERLYHAFLTSNGLDPKTEPSIFVYIDQNRINLSKYFAFKKDKELEIEYVHQANFINSVKTNKRIYDILRRIYLGSIISAYLEVEIGEVKNKIELLLDTNFILGVLDLNSKESTHTCRKILEICDRLGFTKSVLPFTIEETEMLIGRKANQLENAFFQGYLDPESIYNAAKRRNLSKTQLQQIANSLTDTLEKEYKIYTVPSDSKFRNLAKYQYSSILEFYQGLRGNQGFSALHDTTAIVYVKEKRGGKEIKGDIMKANCWFVTNTPFNIATPETNGNLPEIIRAEEILNFLWLSNPSVTQFINSSEISSLGLTRLVSSTISYSLPNPKVLRDLDDNFNAYGGQNITADDTIMVASMIAKKKIAKPEELNKVALQNPDNFIATVKEYADKGRKEEKELTDKLEKVLERLEVVFQKHQEEKKEKNEKEITVEQNLVPTSEINNLPIADTEKDQLKRVNKVYRLILITIGISTLSALWWTLEKIFTLPIFASHLNLILIKVLGQVLIATLTLGIFKKDHKPAWITTSIALFIAIITCLKK